MSQPQETKVHKLIYGVLGVIILGLVIVYFQDTNKNKVSTISTLNSRIDKIKETDINRNYEISDEEAQRIATEAYIYLYPLITMDLTRRQQTLSPKGSRPGAGPINNFHHMREYPDSSFRDVVRPNFDTLYSIAWLDLTAGPVKISIPSSEGRFFLMPFYDMFTDSYAVLGSRTTGHEKQDVFVVGPNFNGEVPEGYTLVKSPTFMTWVIGRTQTNGAKDYKAVRSFQNGMKITSVLSEDHLTIEQLSQKLKFPDVDIERSPLKIVNEMDSITYFKYGMDLLKLHAPHLTDTDIILRMKRIGLNINEKLNIDNLPSNIQSALSSSREVAQAFMKEAKPKLANIVNGWQMNTTSMGTYGNFYLKRALVCFIGLGALPAQDAIYPLNFMDSNGDILQASNDYIIKFEKGELPPAKAFWSITMYDEEGFAVDNELDRYVIGSRDDLKFNEDGSLNIYIQAERPSEDKVGNWLPSAKKGVMGVTLRLYNPEVSALDGKWSPPKVIKSVSRNLASE
ncbi:PF06863 family protein [Bacteriovorax sp. BAL6_X]|uniref:DUF1254 domain-containing protein n=1 Tax=Bacteriovorax sp. BAL6_X TaxID=1201290 RepID=UPI000385E3C1|nr:DUF1254 domain-containing protein [Bacteriovorax sp. BAL6_X]EPZ49601.1 PF06863 family protein [Bacteriovorax sp. BAL6_X]